MTLGAYVGKVVVPVLKHGQCLKKG